LEPASGRSQVWQYLEPDGDSVSSLGNELSVSSLTAALLVNRNLKTPEDALRFINPNLKDLPSPFLLKGMDAAASIKGRSC
jgi:single-stranded-DNA-specific exonuclease